MISYFYAEDTSIIHRYTMQMGGF